MNLDPRYFEERRHGSDIPRSGDIRTQYERDRARLLHSAAFRRLQGKTQVMGVGEGDFHRTRLTHSIECAQIGNGLLQVLNARQKVPKEFQAWMPSRDLIEAACYGHDLGHPPFGHGGEVALHRHMINCGGFEGNGHTLRIIARLEKYKENGHGLDPTRRLVLAILKYPVPYRNFNPAEHKQKPPKCYFNEEDDIVQWAFQGFDEDDKFKLSELNANRKPIHRTFDCSLMELADDIAYGIHDIEDIVARKLATRSEVSACIEDALRTVGGKVSNGQIDLTANSIVEALFGDSFQRKQIISDLVNIFVTNVVINKKETFAHPLLSFQANLDKDYRTLLSALKDLSYDLIISKAELQQLEQRGMRVVEKLFCALLEDPEVLIPRGFWGQADINSSVKRRVCDFVAGMTDAYAEKIYRRLFIPGFGSSSDEL